MVQHGTAWLETGHTCWAPAVLAGKLGPLALLLAETA